MTQHIENIVLEIDKEIRRHTWFDFHILSFDGNNLIVGGSLDLTYYHKLEIIFEDVFFVSGFFKVWHTNTTQTAFMLPANESEMNSNYETEQGYQLFIFKTEGYVNDVVIAAKKLSFNTDIVYYYERHNLKANERIAEFVKRKVLQ